MKLEQTFGLDSEKVGEQSEGPTLEELAEAPKEIAKEVEA